MNEKRAKGFLLLNINKIYSEKQGCYLNYFCELKKKSGTPVMVSCKTIAICESNQQVKWLIRQSKYSDKISHWIAANPSAYWELKHRNVFFSELESYQMHKSSQKIESLQFEQINWAKKVDAFLQKKIPVFKSVNFCPTLYYLYYLKNSWDTFINRADLLEQISNEMPLDEIFFFNNPHPTKFSSVLTFSGSILSECIPLWADYHGIKCTPLPALLEDMFLRSQVHMKNGIRRNITSKLPQFLINHLQSILSNPNLLNFPSGVLSTDCKKKILVKTSYDMTQDISQQLWKIGFKPLSFDGVVARNQKNADKSPPTDQFSTEAWLQVSELGWFWQPGGWQNWSLRNSLEPLFHHFWFNIIPELWKSMNSFRILIQNQNPVAICVPLIWDTNETGFIMAAHAENIPVIFYQHGACMGDTENTIWDLTDSFYSDYQLVYGEGAAKYIRSRRNQSGSCSVPIPVGSARLDRIRCGMPNKKVLALRRSILGSKDKPLIVYVPGVLFNNFYRYDYQDFRHCRIFDVRSRLAEIFNTHEGVHFSYKAFVSSGHDPTLEMLKETCPMCTVIDTIPLTELQWLADFLIYETPGTGMYEGLVTNKPMIVYVDRDVYQMSDEVKKMLGMRLGVAETDKEFIEKVIQFLDRRDFSPLVNPDREFVKTFCTHLDDGKSAERAAEAIFSIVKMYRNKAPAVI